MGSSPERQLLTKLLVVNIYLQTFSTDTFNAPFSQYFHVSDFLIMSPNRDRIYFSALLPLASTLASGTVGKYLFVNLIFVSNL